MGTGRQRAGRERRHRHANYRGRDLKAPNSQIHPDHSRWVSSVSPARTEHAIRANELERLGVPYREEITRCARPALVNLEDEMMKVAANQMDHQAATALYTRSLNLLKIALGKR